MMSRDWFPHIIAGNNRIALRSGNISISYGELAKLVMQTRQELCARQDYLEENRIVFLYPASIDYVALLLATLSAGGLAVPLSMHATIDELEHCLKTADTDRIFVDSTLCSPELLTLADKMGLEVIRFFAPYNRVSQCEGEISLAPVTIDSRGLMVFTSGTTGKPKGVVHTVAGISAMITSLVEAWHWQRWDVIPLILPLHHVHGIVNILLCGLWAGATIDLFPRFEIEPLIQRVAKGNYTIFMAVPTIYAKLCDHLDSLQSEEAQTVVDGFANMRLNVSGSAACPVPLFERWQSLTGQTLLERYGMTELGMAISNPYLGERRAGFVGQPLPGVRVCRMNELGERVTNDSVPGEIAVRSPTMFLEYWRAPEGTRRMFRDGWFMTGDVAILDHDAFQILGRASIDIIKSGGYKISALEIEAVLLEHPSISEAAVIGLPDEIWGEIVAATLVLRNRSSINHKDLAEWCNLRLSDYKRPRRWHFSDKLPKNALGKVIKSDLRSFFN